MITWNIYINNTLVDEPQGWADITLRVSRDPDWHGVFFEAATSSLMFYGDGATLLKAEKQANGLAASATFRAEAICGQTIDILEGQFDFGTYVEKCGNDCYVQIAIEKPGCTMTMKNRYDQKVDIQKRTSFNDNTLLAEYTGLNFPITLTAQKLQLGNEANMTDTQSEIISSNVNWVDSDGFNNYIGWIAPPLPEITNESFGEFNASPIIDLAGPLEGVPNRPPYPDFPNATGTATIIGGLACAFEDTVVEFRVKGTASVVFTGAAGVGMTVKIFRLPVGLDGTVAANWVEEYASPIFSRLTTGSDTFDLEDSEAITVTQGDFIYYGISTRGDSLGNISNFTLTFDPECYFRLLTSSTCEDSTANVSLVNELGSRIVESITDRCLTMKSDYYGRTDSEPYDGNSDGCGSLRVITNGLKIRNAETSNHFISLQDFYDGLKGIDNIGMGIEDNTEAGTGEWLRIEPVEYFYQNVRIMGLPYIPASESSLQPDMGYSTIKVGYNKWEAEEVNGLTEFNSTKDFRTSLSTIKNEIDITSNFVAAGIAIERTRQQSFALSGAADTKFDNDNFIVCVERSGYDYIVEKNIITSPANIFSPATVYNWRIRPMYNLMRWFKSIAHTYANLVSTTSKLFFASGTGNYIAEGRITTPDPCDLENKVLAENDDLTKDDYIGTGGVPIFKPEIITFTYPLSIADYILIKATPYGYLDIQCGTGAYEKAFIKSIEYKPVKGEANFTLIKQWV